ncbi:MAG: hypothetical protein Q9184_004227 [Pyrenodesmia sp. 2 TL-2023]
MSAYTPPLLFTTQTKERPGAGHASGISLVSEFVLGSTISSVNALSAATEANSFAFCAGPAVILAEVSPQLELVQRLFSAKPDTLLSQATLSCYNPATPTKATGNRGCTTSLSQDEPASGSPLLASTDHHADSPGRVTSAHRSRSLTTVALNPSGKLLAVGEIGHRPRILVFSTTPNAYTDKPLACLTEHTFGVRALAFSHDSRWLCSLGDLHDGGLFLWSINPKTGALRLNSSNRCTTADTITWMGANVVSVGTRHVKIWRLEQPYSPSKGRRGLDNLGDGSTASPVPKTFAGRNCLLGLLKDATFTCVTSISADRAILGTQDGAICLLDDANRTQRLYQVSRKAYGITCMAVDHSSGTVWLGGKGVEPEALPLDVFLTAEDASAVPRARQALDERGEHKRGDSFRELAICCVDKLLVAVDSSRFMHIYNVGFRSQNIPTLSAAQELPAHESPILGVVILPEPNKAGSDFLTYTGRGHVFHWLWNGTCTSRFHVRLEHPLALALEESNELRVIRATSVNSMLLAGDKAGLLRSLSASGEAQAVVKAHEGEIYDIVLTQSDQNNSFAASCGRDKIIQIFLLSKDSCLIQQSLLNEHTGPIRKLEFADRGSILLSMSPGRTIVIHKRIQKSEASIAYISAKVISLKATPLAMALLPAMTPSLLVSSTDRRIRKISIAEGHVTHTVKTTEYSHSVFSVISRLSVGTLSQQLTSLSVVAGFSSADRSIRLYDIDTGSLLAIEHGQTAVSDLALGRTLGSNGETIDKIVTTGLDGTIMIWSISALSRRSGCKNDAGSGSHDDDPSRTSSPAALRPLRRVLSKTQIAQYQKSLEEQEEDAPTSSSNLSPSRLRRKTSKKLQTVRAPQAPAGACFHRSKIKPVSPPPSPRTSLPSRSRRSSLDERHRGLAGRRNIDTTTKQLHDTLRDYRKQLTTSKESLGLDTLHSLQRELDVTLKAVSQKMRPSDPNEGTGSEIFDDRLARMIDDRLALRFKSEDQANSTEDRWDTDPLSPKSTRDPTL